MAMMVSPDHDPEMKTADDEIIALLPFYVTNKLDSRDRSRVEQWLQMSPHAQVALERAAGELAATQDANEAIRVPAGALARLNAELGSTKARRERSDPTEAWWERVANVFDFGDRRLAWAMASALVVAFLVHVSLPSVSPGPGSYELAGGKDTAAPSGGPVALVVFTRNASMSDVTRLLGTYGARMVSGPRGPGAYEIQFNAESDTPVAERMKRFAAQTALVALFQTKSAAEN
jgi:hypothetical protein